MCTYIATHARTHKRAQHQLLLHPRTELEEAVNRRRLEVGLPADVVGVELQAGEGTAYCVKYVEELQRAAGEQTEGGRVLCFE